MFGREKHSPEVFESALQQKEIASKNLAHEATRLTREEPPTQYDKEALALAKKHYNEAEARIEKLRWSAAQEAAKLDKDYEVLREHLEDAFDAYRAAEEEITRFEKEKLDMHGANTHVLSEEDIVD